MTWSLFCSEDWHRAFMIYNLHIINTQQLFFHCQLGSLRPIFLILNSCPSPTRPNGKDQKFKSTILYCGEVNTKGLYLYIYMITNYIYMHFHVKFQIQLLHLFVQFYIISTFSCDPGARP